MLYFVYPKNKYKNILKLTKIKPFNRYETVIKFISSLLTEVTDTKKIYKMFINFSKQINELKSDYLAGQDEGTDDVIENLYLVHKMNNRHATVECGRVFGSKTDVKKR